MIDVIGGHTKVMFSSLVQTTPHIRSGKLRALGTGGIEAQSGAARRADRSRKPACRATRPSTGGASLRRPARPPPIVEKLHKAIAAVQDADEVQEAVRHRGRRNRADELGRIRAPSSRTEMNKWERVVKEGGIKAE